MHLLLRPLLEKKVMKKFTSKEFIIGLSVIIGLVILYFGINYLKGVNLFKPGNYYYVNYENVAGLETAAPVTVDGYKVGEVREINFDYNKPGNIVVALSVNKNLRLPKDTKAVIVSGLMSGASIELKLGKSKEYVDVDGFITGALQAGLMDAVGNDIMPTVTDLLPHIDSLVVSLNATANNLARLSAKEELDRSLNNVERITSDLAALSSTLNNTFGKGAPELMGDATEITENLKKITEDVSKLTAELNNLPLQSSMDNINKMTENLETLSRNLNSTNGTLGKLMNDPTLYNQLNRVTADIDSLINDLKKNPKRYVNIKLL